MREPLFAARKWKISMLSNMGEFLSGPRTGVGRFGPKKETMELKSGECGRSYDDMAGLIRSTGTPTHANQMLRLPISMMVAGGLSVFRD